MRLFAEFDRVAAEYSPPHDRLAVDPMYGQRHNNIKNALGSSRLR